MRKKALHTPKKTSSEMQTAIGALDTSDSEIVIGVVSAVGTDQDWMENALGRSIGQHGYRPNVIRLSDLLRKEHVTTEGDGESGAGGELSRIERLMDAGTAARVQRGRGDLLALYAVSELHQMRTSSGTREATRMPRTAHVLRSLKHPDEVHALRRIYGPGFFLLGLYASEEDRLNYLVHHKDIAKSEARRLIARDEAERHPLGQQTRKTFALADAFIRLRPTQERRAHLELGRILDLVLGAPYVTPTRDEYAMFLAFSAALRSGDLSRQVGAVVADRHGDVVASGANDVPRFGGGLYWPERGDARDYTRREDSNERWRDEAIVEVTRLLLADAAKLSDAELLEIGKQRLSGSRVLDITEFGRAVHAEMEALLACARSGVSPRGGTLYTTTFPCHNCAKHIVASGIERVVYVEPYPKTKARDLHGDSLSVEISATKKVLFEPFIGLGPRRFFDLFSMELSTGAKLQRKLNGRTIQWDRKTAQPRVPMLPIPYIGREAVATLDVGLTIKGTR